MVAGDNVTLVEKKTDKGLEYTVTAKDTTYSAGDNVAIDKDNKISVDLSKYAETEDVAVVYDQNKTSLRSTNASVAENAIALGKGASAVENSIAIGNGAYTQDGTLTKGQSVALGNGAVTGAKSTSIGSNAIGGREGTITIGANANNGSLYATIIGTDSVINSDETAYKVKIDTFLGPIEKDVNIQGATATLVGTSNKVDNKNNLVYSGVANNVMGAANTIEASNGVTIQGTGNKVTDAYKDMNITTNEGLAILGGDYSVLAKKQSGAVAVVGGANTVSKQTDSTVIGYDNQLIGGEENISHDVFMAGSHNTLTNVSDSIVMGNENAITGVSNVISFGHQNEITANNAVAIGNGAGVSVEDGVALGVGSVASTAAGALGYGAAEGETGIAWKATNGAVSVGSSVEGKKITRQITNVAAGTADTDAVNVAQLKKVSEAAASASQGWKLKTKNGNASDVKPGDEVEFDGDANIQVGNNGNKVSVTLKDTLTGITSITGAGEGAGSISFADGGIKFNNNVTIDNTGKISGVADGVNDNDAVNVGQLKKFVSKGNTDSHIKAGEYEVGADNKVSMDIVDKNGQSTGEKVTIKDVAKASDVGDVSKIDKDIQNKEGNTTVVDAVNNVNNKVGDLNYSQVAKGDLVNGDNTTTAIGKLNQKLSDVEKTAGAHSTVSTDDSGNISVTPTKDEKTGVTDYKVSLNKDLKLDSVKVGENVSLTKDGLTAGDTKVTNAGLSIGDKTYVTKDGLNANGNKVTHVADGKVEEGSTDAVNGGQLYNETRVAKDGNFVKKSNTAGENLSALDNQVTANTESIYHMNGRISDLDNRVNKVGAGAAALAALHPLDFDPDAKWDFAAGYGNYRGANAAAVGAYYRPNEDTMFSVGGTFGNGENMVNAGVSFKLGSGSSHVSTSRVAMAKEIKELRGELEAMKSAMLDANAGKKIDTSKLQLFPDVPQNHWAYEYVAQLAGNGMIEGYPDGNFAGDRPMTRYEFAAILYRAMTKGAVLSDKILSEFSHELEYFTVDTIAKDKAGNPTIQRVRTVKENKNK